MQCEESTDVVSPRPRINQTSVQNPETISMKITGKSHQNILSHGNNMIIQCNILIC